MKTTLNRGYPYPEPTGDGADVAYWMQRTAEAVDADVDTISDKVDARAPAVFQPLSVVGWSASGLIVITPMGNKKQVVVDIAVSRTGADSAAPASVAFQPLFTVLPAGVLGLAANKTVPVALSGNNAQRTIDAFLNPSTGELKYRTTAAFTWANLQQFTLNTVYYI